MTLFEIIALVSLTQFVSSMAWTVSNGGISANPSVQFTLFHSESWTLNRTVIFHSVPCDLFGLINGEAFLLTFPIPMFARTDHKRSPLSFSLIAGGWCLICAVGQNASGFASKSRRGQEQGKNNYRHLPLCSKKKQQVIFFLIKSKFRMKWAEKKKWNTGVWFP